MAWLSDPGRLAFLLVGAVGCGAGASSPEAAAPTVFIPFVGVAAPAPAPVVVRAPLDRPGHYRVAFSARRDHGCSLSYAIRDARGEYVLDLAADGRAELTIASTTTDIFGSRMSPAAGGGMPTREATSSATSWKGEARETKGHLDVVLHEARATCGAPGAGRTCHGPKSVKLACAFERVDVAAAPDPDHADVPPASVKVDVLRCDGGPSPFGDEDPAFAQHLALSSTAALAMSSHGGRWSVQQAPALFLERNSP